MHHRVHVHVSMRPSCLKTHDTHNARDADGGVERKAPSFIPSLSFRSRAYPSPSASHTLLFAMIYDVKSDYYQTFLSSKQGIGGTKTKASSNASTAPSSTAPDAMDTDD